MRLDVLDIEGAGVVHRVVLHQKQIRSIHRDCDASIVECLDVARVGHGRHAEQEVGDTLRLEDAAVALFDDRGGDRCSVVVGKSLAEREDHLVATGLVALRKHAVDLLGVDAGEVDSGDGLVGVLVLGQLVKCVLDGRLRRLAADGERRVERVDVAFDRDHQSVGRSLGGRGGAGAMSGRTCRQQRIDHAETECGAHAVLEHVSAGDRGSKRLPRCNVFQSTALPFHRYLPGLATVSGSGCVASCAASPKASSSSLDGVAKPPILLGRQPSSPRSARSSAYLKGATVASTTGTPSCACNASKNPYSAVQPRTTTSAPSLVTAS